MKIFSKHVLVLVLVVVLTLAVLVITLSTQNDDEKNYPSQSFTYQLTECTEKSKSYLGRSESEAVQMAKQANSQYRIVAKDGERFAVTEDYSPSRLNFEIEGGTIKQASCG